MDNELLLYRIREVERLTGIKRGTIQFYIKVGILHKPFKTGKTMAYYDDTHVHKLLFIQKAKEQKLPLIVIRHKIEREDQKEGFGSREANFPIFQEKKIKNSKDILNKKTRIKILSEGSRIFMIKGYNATTVNDICLSLGIGKASFYYYFSNKKELFLECVPKIFEKLLTKFLDPIRKEKDPYKRLIMRTQLKLPVIMRLAMILSLSKEAENDGDPKLRQLGKQVYLSICRPIESDIEKGIKQGSFNPVDPTLVSNIILGLCHQITADPKIFTESFRSDALNLFSAWLLHKKK